MDLPHRRGIRPGNGKAGLDILCPLEEELDAGKLEKGVQAFGRSGVQGLHN